MLLLMRWVVRHASLIVAMGAMEVMIPADCGTDQQEDVEKKQGEKNWEAPVNSVASGRRHTKERSKTLDPGLQGKRDSMLLGSKGGEKLQILKQHRTGTCTIIRLDPGLDFVTDEPPPRLCNSERDMKTVDVVLSKIFRVP